MTIIPLQPLTPAQEGYILFEPGLESSGTVSDRSTKTHHHSQLRRPLMNLIHWGTAAVCGHLQTSVMPSPYQPTPVE